MFENDPQVNIDPLFLRFSLSNFAAIRPSIPPTRRAKTPINGNTAILTSSILIIHNAPIV
jgi:hypothetical protein